MVKKRVEKQILRIFLRNINILFSNNPKNFEQFPKFYPFCNHTNNLTYTHLKNKN